MMVPLLRSTTIGTMATPKSIKKSCSQSMCDSWRLTFNGIKLKVNN